MNWCLLATCVTSLLLLLAFEEKYERMNIDLSLDSIKVKVEESNEEPASFLQSTQL